MPCRLTSSTKTPSPWTSRLSSLRGTLWPAPALLRRLDRAPGRRVVSLISRHFADRLDRLDDVPVAGAAADVALERLPDLVLGRARVLAQQRGRAHQHPGRAVAALERVVLAERLLERRQLVVRGEALDRLDARAVGLDGEQHAALHEHRRRRSPSTRRSCRCRSRCGCRSGRGRRGGSGSGACAPRPRARRSSPLTVTVIRRRRDRRPSAPLPPAAAARDGEHLGEVARGTRPRRGRRTAGRAFGAAHGRRRTAPSSADVGRRRATGHRVDAAERDADGAVRRWRPR